jgi:hypothetical protein
MATFQVYRDLPAKADEKARKVESVAVQTKYNWRDDDEVFYKDSKCNYADPLSRLRDKLLASTFQVTFLTPPAPPPLRR